MTEDEYKQLKATLDRIAEHQGTLTLSSRAAEDRFSPVEKGIADLLGSIKKRISDRLGGQRPPLNE
jgi:hypothetical protein